jgi:hypothetical protein
VIKKLQMQEIDVIFGHLGYLKMDSQKQSLSDKGNFYRQNLPPESEF